MKKSSTCLVDDFCCTPCGVRRRARRLAFGDFNLMHPMRGATNLKLGIYPTYVISIQCTPCGVQHLFLRYIFEFQSNAPHAGCNSKTIQSKRILVTRRMYSFANCVLYTLKHLPTYCIGTTLQPLIFGAKLPVILC